jgi:hypothetical protein
MPLGASETLSVRVGVLLPVMAALEEQRAAELQAAHAANQERMTRLNTARQVPG